MKLWGTGEGIPLFQEVLQVVNGRVPLIVELKAGSHNQELCQKGWAILKDYAGPYCIESFDPQIGRWFKKNAPGVLRGQLTNPPKPLWQRPTWQEITRGNLLTNPYNRPQFVAYGPDPKPWTTRWVGAMGAIRGWGKKRGGT
ncbi:MAG: hypothetical protein HFE94_03000 [Acutalibacter sp.]|nr:hypothetical protein [Acutalibacter sp.]